MTKHTLIWVCVVFALTGTAFGATIDPALWDLSVTKKTAPEKWQGVTKKTETKTNYFLPTGFTFPVRLENTIYSFVQQSPVILVTERDIVYLNRVVIPTETRIIGAALVEKNNDRILVQFGVMVFPTGDEVHFSGMALSLDGSIGLRGKVEAHKDASVANTLLSSFVSGAQTALTVSGISPIASGATAGLASEATKELEAEKQQHVDKSITVEAEAPVRVYLNQRLEF